MSSDTDVTDLSLLLCFYHRFIHAGAVTGRIASADTVELIYIEIICFKISKCRIEVFPELIRSLCLGF